jgi:uncharacterized membrane protein
MLKLLDEIRKGFQVHPVAAHFSNGILPVAVLYAFLALLTGNLFFEHTVLHLLVIVTLAVPVSFYSGIREWKAKYKGATTPVFDRKIRLSVLLLVLCLIAVAIRVTVPEVAERGGVLAWLYAGSLVAMFPTVVLLGHYGGKLSAGQRTERFR